MLDKLSAGSFENHLESVFWLDRNSENPIALKLVEVTRYENPSYQSSEESREPFSIIFLGPDQPLLRQDRYRLRHDQLGALEGLFLVPVGKNEQGCYYQAVFN